MAGWAVHRNDTQFAVAGLSELRDLAKSGRLSAGDMVQPPGTAGWLYASEIPELKDALRASLEHDEHDGAAGAGGSSVVNVAVAVLLLAVTVACGWYIVSRINLIPDKASTERGMTVKFSELIVTVDDAKLLSEAREGASVVKPVAKNTRLDLLAKRGEFYSARMGKDAEGWIPTSAVLPAYRLGGSDVSREMDPLYNPDQYVKVGNMSWMKHPEKKGRVTVFSFLMENLSKYDMTDLRLIATIKDSKGHELEKHEFKVEGKIPAMSDTMVGTVTDPATKEKRLVTQTTFQEVSMAQPDLKLSYVEGAEVELAKDDFNAATIEIVELRAIPESKLDL